LLFSFIIKISWTVFLQLQLEQKKVYFFRFFKIKLQTNFKFVNQVILKRSTKLSLEMNRVILITVCLSISCGCFVNGKAYEYKEVNCTNTRTCNNGTCTDKKCVCFPGYVTFGKGGACSYKQKEKLTAFLLSFFIGNTGADWFYLASNQGYPQNPGSTDLIRESIDINILYKILGNDQFHENLRQN
jgi:hypothetical protein